MLPRAGSTTSGLTTETDMNPSELLRLIDSISRDRNVDKEALYADIEQAMVSAARKHFNAPDTEDFSCELDRLSGKIVIRRGTEEISLEELGRIPAQTAKQVMIHRFRDDERASIFEEFSDRVGEQVTGMAQRYEGGALVVQIGRAEGFMPRGEQIPGEQHQPGERVRCLILDVRDVGSQVKIVLSRAHPDFIRRLFEVEVPEVAERIIEVKAMAREAGHRTKIAVSSIDSKVDAVGACVGVRGSRIKNIVDELGGEKIDIVRWNESSQILIQNSLKPAEVVEISLCFELGGATVVVNEDQLSLAIGKRGQNVRLAARLTGWDVNILTPAEFTKGLDTLEETVKQVDDITEDQIDRLAALGVISVFDVEEVGTDYLVESIQCTPEQAAQMIELAAARAKIVAVEQQREKEEAERRKAEEAAALAGQPGERQAASILGDDLGLPLPAAGEPESTAEGAVAPAPAANDGGIVQMLESRQQAQADEETVATDAESAPPSEAPAESAEAQGDDEAVESAEVQDDDEAVESVPAQSDEEAVEAAEVQGVETAPAADAGVPGADPREGG